MNKIIETEELKIELKETQQALYEALNRIDKAIDFIKENCSNYYVDEPHYRGIELLNIEELLEILGDKENE